MKWFGTDGVRGIPGRPPLTCEDLIALSRAVAAVLEYPERRLFVVRDTRSSGAFLETALTAGFLALGWNVWHGGVLPTSAAALFAREGFLGCVLSASHNPFEYNGIKLFAKGGGKLSKEQEEQIERLWQKREGKNSAELGERREFHEEAKGRYLQFLLHSFAPSLQGKTILLDCAQGATFEVAPLVFELLGAKVVSLGTSPNGRNINQNCGALYPERLRKEVLREKAWLGFAFDGDGDRLIWVDEKGNVRDGDFTLALLATYFQEKGVNLPKVVTTVMSNFGLEEYLAKRGIGLCRTQVGDKHVWEAMQKEDSPLGGEPSGHILLSSFHTTGDGILTALALCEALLEFPPLLSQVSREFQSYPQLLSNIPVRRKIPFSEMPDLAKAIEEAEASLKGQGRLLLRYSGTEPLLRIMVEGKDIELLEKTLRFLETKAKTCLSP